MSEKIEVTPFDTCILLQLQSPNADQPIRKIKTLHEFDVFKSIEVKSELALEMIDLINSLPRGEQMRCHIPGYGLELLNRSKQIFVCSICWQCNNIFAINNDEDAGRTFNGKSAKAIELLKKFRLSFEGR